MNKDSIELGCWCYGHIGESLPPDRLVEDWATAGLTLGMTPAFDAQPEQTGRVQRLLDAAADRRLRVILMHRGLGYRVLKRDGEAAYRQTLAAVRETWGGHPAVYGVFVGDEPDADHVDAACRACRIQRAEAPDWSPFCNLDPWWPEGDARGHANWGAFLDGFAERGRPPFLCYDCYSQLKPGNEGYEMYFRNLKWYHDAARRAGIPFWTTLLSVGHFRYAPPTLDDFRWQLSTACAHGARGILWFYFHHVDRPDNYRLPPVDILGERTPTFDALRRAQLEFMDGPGGHLARLSLQSVYHVGRAWGGWPRLDGHGIVQAAASEEGPDELIVSEYLDAGQQPHFSVLNASRRDSNLVCVTVRAAQPALFRLLPQHMQQPELVLRSGDRHGTRISGNQAEVRCWLAPGQMEVFRVEHRNSSVTE